MRKPIVNLLWMVSATALLVVASPTAARAEARIVAAVPFSFIVGDSRLPAGDYVISESFDTPDVLRITSTDGRQIVFILTIASSPNERAASSLVFEQFAGQHFLSRVEPGDGDAREIVLTPAIMERELVTTASNTAP